MEPQPPKTNRNGLARIGELSRKRHALICGPTQHINPAVFLGLGPCTLNGVSYTTCSTTANTRSAPPAESGESADRTIFRLCRSNSTPAVRPAITACSFPFSAAPRAASPSAGTTPGRIASAIPAAGQHPIRLQPDLKARRIRTTGALTAAIAPSRRRIGGMFSICRQWPKRRSSPTRRCALSASGWRFSPIFKILSGGYLSVTTSQDRALNGTGEPTRQSDTGESLRRQIRQQLSQSRSIRATGARHVRKCRRGQHSRSGHLAVRCGSLQNVPVP